MPVSREERTIVRIAIGFGLLLGWLDTLMRGRDALSGLVRNDLFREGNALPAFVFLAAHIFSFLAVAVAARSPGFLPRRRFLQLSGGILALAFPLAASLGSLFGEGAILFASGLSGAGTAFLVGGWAAAFCTLPRQEAALAYALAAFFAVLSVLYASAWNGAATLLPFAGPVVSALLLFTAPPPTEASGTFSEKVDTETLRPGKFAMFLTIAYILYGLGSGMFSLLTSTLSRHAYDNYLVARGVAPLVALALLSVTSRKLPSPFYRFSLFLVGASFLLLPLPRLSGISAYLLESGLAIFDLYAWLLLLRWGRSAGPHKDSVLHFGLFLISGALAVGTLNPLAVAKTMFSLFAEGHAYLAPFLTAILLLLCALYVPEGPARNRNSGGNLPPDKEQPPDTPLPPVSKNHSVPPLFLQAHHAAEALSSEQTEPLSSTDEGHSGKDVFHSEKEDRANGNVGTELQEFSLRLHLESLGLTRQESSIVLLLLQGLKDKEMCARLVISRNTLKYHLRNIYRKLAISSRKELPGLFEADRTVSS
jgi:DNA-binding CsgD family transcriptional regulator